MTSLLVQLHYSTKISTVNSRVLIFPRINKLFILIFSIKKKEPMEPAHHAETIG